MVLIIMECVSALVFYSGLKMLLFWSNAKKANVVQAVMASTKTNLFPGC